MWIRRLEVTHCAGIAAASVDLEPGLNVLHGPNELGKSTLAAAIRAALLMQSQSSAAERLRDWHVDALPEVTLTFEQEPHRNWRVRKRFGGSGAFAYLDFSRDGRDFAQDSRGREVDGALQALLRWGIEAPGGRRGRRGMPSSLITTALLGQQEEATAILDASLADDADDSGKQRLTEALQALAEDPRFKSVLNAVQEKVDEAFTSTGRRKAGRVSPWTQLREDRENAARRKRDVDAQLDESHAAQEKISALELVLADARDEAEKAHTILALRRDHERVAHILREAEHERQRVAAIFDRVGDNRTSTASATEEVSRLEGKRDQANSKLDELDIRREEAEARVRELETGSAEQGRRLREQELEARRLRLEAAEGRHRDLVEALTSAIALHDQISALDTQLARKRNRLDEEDATSARQRDELRDLECHRSVIRYLAARTEADRRRTALDEVQAYVVEAEKLDRRAQEIRAEASRFDAPEAAEIERLRTLRTDLRIAKEKLSVGIVVQVALAEAHDADVQADGEPHGRALAAGETAEFEAERELRLAIPDIGSIHVRGGGRALLREAEDAEARWAQASHRTFARTGCTSVEELAELRQRVDNLLADATELESRASEARVRTEGMDALERQVIEANAETEERASAVRALLQDGESFNDRIDNWKMQVGTTTESAVKARIQELDQEIRKTTERRDQWRDEASRDERQVAVKNAELKPLRTRVGGASDPADWPRRLADAKTAANAAGASVAEVENALQAIRQESSDEVAQARAALSDLEDRCQSARTELADAEGAVLEARDRLKGLEGEFKPLQEAAENEDLGKAEAARDEAQRAFNGLAPLPDEARDVDIDDLADAATVAEHRADTLRSELDKAQGALEQVGGQYLEEQAAQVEDEVDTLDSRERELELDYGGWRMLHEVLKEAEEEETAHLGRALVKPVSQRMAALTGNRYGEVAIDAQLNPGGIELGGDERDFEALSAGTREQIALLLRLSIAEALNSFVILDDQLTQSDGGRLTWMRDLLGQAAADIQIIVLTCHPDDYATAGACHTVDLAQCITRTD
ncbi:MAG: hypothetical protein OXK76_06485 [Gammaproteobacteria bacterium]|nr:hypothetical protein [Gammaproteobacteria bacterium]